MQIGPGRALRGIRDLPHLMLFPPPPEGLPVGRITADDLDPGLSRQPCGLGRVRIVEVERHAIRPGLEVPGGKAGDLGQRGVGGGDGAPAEGVGAGRYARGVDGDHRPAQGLAWQERVGAALGFLPPGRTHKVQAPENIGLVGNQGADQVVGQRGDHPVLVRILPEPAQHVHVQPAAGHGIGVHLQRQIALCLAPPGVRLGRGGPAEQALGLVELHRVEEDVQGQSDAALRRRGPVVAEGGDGRDEPAGVEMGEEEIGLLRPKPQEQRGHAGGLFAAAQAGDGQCIQVAKHRLSGEFPVQFP